jgi:hypothetical protein
MQKAFKKFGFIFIAISIFASFSDHLPVRLRIVSAIAATVFKVKLPPPPPNRGIAGNRVGGASRISSKDPMNEGTKSDRHLTALVPEYRQPTQGRKSPAMTTKIWGLTANEYPTLLFYIPYDRDSIVRIDLILTDGDNPTNRMVYQNSIQPPTQRGIVPFSLPKTSVPLAIDKLYQWELKLTMKRQLEREISVKGWIQRANLSSELSDLINQATPERKAALYAENGFWYDALSTLAELRRDRSNDLGIQQDWKNILQSVDLGKLANQPFVR